MPENVYEVISLGARYWFILLGVLLVLRTFRWLRRDRKATHDQVHSTSGIGMIGELSVISSDGDLQYGMTMPVPYEGVMGSVRTCDLVIPDADVAPQHCDFSLIPGKGVVLRPRRHCIVYVNNREIASARKGTQLPLHHNSQLQIGSTILQLRVFPGIDAGPAEELPYPQWLMQQPPNGNQPTFQWYTGEQYPLYGQPPADPQQPVYPQQYGAPPHYPDADNEDIWAGYPFTAEQPPQQDNGYPFDNGYLPRNRRGRRHDDAQS